MMMIRRKMDGLRVMMGTLLEEMKDQATLSGENLSV